MRGGARPFLPKKKKKQKKDFRGRAYAGSPPLESAPVELLFSTHTYTDTHFVSTTPPKPLIRIKINFLRIVSYNTIVYLIFCFLIQIREKGVGERKQRGGRREGKKEKGDKGKKGEKGDRNKGVMERRRGVGERSKGMGEDYPLSPLPS